MNRASNQQGVQKMTIIVGIIVLLIIGALAVYAVSQSNEDTNANANGDTMMEENTNIQDDAMMEDDNANTNEAMMEDDDSMMEEENTNSVSAAGEYTPYSEAVFAAASDQKRVLFFYASWCPTCRPADQDIASRTDEIPAGLTIFRTDYDTENALKDTYGITYQHTFVQVDADGNMIKKWNGGSLDQIIENVI